MINNLFINIILLIAFTFTMGHVLKDISKTIINTFYCKALVGISGGLLGILLIIYSINIDGTKTLIDLRVFAIMIISCIDGIMATVISGVIIILYRTLHYGISISSIIAMLQMLLYIVIFYIIDKNIKTELDKWVSKSLMVLIIIIPTTYYLLSNLENIWIIIAQFSFVIVIVSIIEYFLLDYVQNSNELYLRYKRESAKDFLTGLSNARTFNIILKTLTKRVIETNKQLSCLMIDIDNFKKINDTFGHSAGDRVLKELAPILKKNCRTFDIVSRLGGEEFCILLFDCSKNKTFEIAWRINKVVEKHKFVIGENKFLDVTVSIGVAVYPETTSKLKDIKEEADKALYKAKRSGRNKVCCANNCID